MRIWICALAGALAAGHVAAQDLPTVTVLTEGYVAPIEGREFVPGTAPDGARLVATTIVLVQAEGATIVVDPGMVAEGFDLIARLAEEGVVPEDVTHVFISHHHPDHIVRVGLFPEATVVDFGGRYTHDLWEDHGDGYEIAPGVRVLQTPGHTDEDASLAVDTADGTYVLTHVWWNENMQPETDPIAEDADALEASRARVLEEADFIIPGHGKLFEAPQ